MTLSGPRREHQQEAGILSGAHLVALSGIEHREEAGTTLGGVTAGQVDPDPPRDDQDPGALMDLVLLELLARWKVDDDRPALVLRIEDDRLEGLDGNGGKVPVAHGDDSILLAAMVIAIDGPAGAGKSTVARALAAGLGITYLDSGAMYRAVALATLRADEDPDDPEAVSAIAAALELELQGDRVELAGDDVSRAIRAPEVSAISSRVSVHPGVRAAMVERQRSMIAVHDYVAEGRDIGTVVSPDAPLKVFLTASAPERARRRAAETGEHARDVLEAQADRDARDTEREHGALRAADDAVEVDTTGMDIDAVVELIADLARERGLA